MKSNLSDKFTIVLFLFFFFSASIRLMAKKENIDDEAF